VLAFACSIACTWGQCLDSTEVSLNATLANWSILPSHGLQSNWGRGVCMDSA
jgi:hypothetical protein